MPLIETRNPILYHNIQGSRNRNGNRENASRVYALFESILGLC